jgi:hypothetical protein
MSQSENGQSRSHSDHAGQKGRFTGERLKLLRPDTYRRVVELLAEPREQVPYDHICRQERVSEHTVKAIEKRESASIAERKEALLAKTMRIAHKAADRIEDQIDGANITQATVAFGVAADKITLLSGDHTIHIQYSIEPGPNLYQRLAELQHRIEANQIQPALQNGETVSRR